MYNGALPSDWGVFCHSVNGETDGYIRQQADEVIWQIQRRSRSRLAALGKVSESPEAHIRELLDLA